MTAAQQAMEHTEHIQHASHGEDHGHGGGHDPKARLGMYVGITMAMLGVMLAFCAAKVGGERTELVQALIERSNAQQEYHAQNVKRRMAFLNLQQLHAEIAANPTVMLDRRDVLDMANTVDRYYEEMNAAKEWSESFEPAIEAHIEGQENYESAQLLTEIGMVIASVALLLRQRAAWVIAIVLGLGSIVVVARTYRHGSVILVAANHRIEHLGHEFHAMRQHNNAYAAEETLIDSVRVWAGAPAGAHAPEHGAPAEPEAHP